jgi:predicted transcriptional regulator of viral defense system
MDNQTNIEKLISSGKKVFTTDDLAIIWGVSDRKKLIGRIKYYLRQRRLIHIYKGLYAYGEYTPLDIAQKLVPMSYLSLYTTSQMHGLTFQYYSTIFCISLKSKKYNVDGQKYEYRKVKDAIFYNDLGLMQEEGHTIANKERTICDLLYVFPGFAFDNLKSVDIEMLHKIATIYDNKRLQKDVSKIIKIIESNEE